MKRVSNYLALLLAAVVLSGCALLPAGRTSQATTDEATPTPIPTPIVPTKPTYTVKRGEIVKATTFSGRISPVVQEDLFFQTDGRVRTIYAKRGDSVEEGQVIADLEIDDLERELTSAKLDLERAQVRLDEAQQDLDYDRQVAQVNLEMETLRLVSLQTQQPQDSNAVALQRKRLELAQIALDRLSHGVDPLLENDVARAKLNVQKLESAVEKARIVAPFDGRLLSVSLSPGRPVEAFKPVVAIADVSELEVSADLLSTQVEDMVEGMPVSLVLVSRPGVELTGEIRRLPYPYGSGGSGQSVEEMDKSTRVSIDQSAADAGFELGDLVRVTVELERKDDVLWVPPQALRTFDGRRFAVVQEEDAQRRVDVTTGIQTQERVEVVEGLEEGQIVIGQ